MKKIVFFLILTVDIFAQKPEKWNAQWITHPDIAVSEYSVVNFRKVFDLNVKPERFIIHISADNHYRLYVNGKYITRGPARGDMAHWFYETIDIATYLKADKNVIAAEVVNWGPKRSFTMFSQMTSFIVQGDTKNEEIINTLGGKWKTYHNLAYKPQIVDWIFDKTTIDFGLYVCGPTDIIDGSKYPWGWEQINFDDKNWLDAKWADAAGGYGTQHAGGILYGNGKILVPRKTELLYERKENLGDIVRISGAERDGSFLKGKTWTVPANSTVSLIIDQGYETIGYPELSLSGGAGSSVRLMYAENLIYKNKGPKNNRNDITNKYLVGIKDTYFNDGGTSRIYRPTYLRAFRFIQMDITTKNEALTINDFYNVLCTAPVELKAKFETNDTRLNQLMPMGWRTVSICAQDILMSDAAYEQMQYTGDSRVHNLTLMTLSGNDKLTRNFLCQIDQSRIPEGLTYACYPNAFHLIIPSYSLIWIDQIYDYMLWKDDKNFIKQFDLGIKSVLHWFDSRIEANGLLGAIEWWPALAWPRHYIKGVPLGMENDNNTLYNLHYAYTLRHAAAIYDYLGDEKESKLLKAKADAICEAVNKYCKRSDGFYKESPKVDSVSQITNILAILAEATTPSESEILMKKLLEPKDWFGQVDIFLHLYLFEALNKTNQRDHFISELSEWYLMLDRNLSTCAEVPLEWGEDKQRSECHPWSTSPHYFFFRTICGIRPTSAGHKSVSLEPYFGDLTAINAIYPHHLGNIEMKLTKDKNQLMGSVIIPKDIKASLVWNNKTIKLKNGINQIDFK
jgi:hypothetical protein